MGSTQLLLSLPPAAAAALQEHPSLPDGCFVASDPPGTPLGSGGGTASLLAAAWRSTGGNLSFGEWLHSARKLVVHGGGQSRRLPAYAGTGKPLMPAPVIRRSFGQSLDSTWLDTQLPYYLRVLDAAPEESVVMVTAGDVLLRFADDQAPLPVADIVALGMPVQPEQAQYFGVFFRRTDEQHLAEFFLQKPSPEEIVSLARDYDFLVDTGMWLLSEAAVMRLMQMCGWDDARGQFRGGSPGYYELYAGMGLSLGAKPRVPDEAVSALSCSIQALDEPEFYHLGTSRQLIEAFTVLQNKGQSVSWMRHPEQFILNSSFGSRRSEANHTLWIENCVLPETWTLACEHVLTGVPANDWALELERGVCLDFAPVGENSFCIRAYGIDDTFSGPLGDPRTQWLGRPALEWFASRGIDPGAAGIDVHSDIHTAPVFPLVDGDDLDAEFVKWLFAAELDPGDHRAATWVALPRLSAAEILSKLNARRLFESRAANRVHSLWALYERGDRGIYHRLDLERTARLWVSAGFAAPEPRREPVEPMAAVRDRMFRSAVMRKRNEPGWQSEEREAFDTLREAVLGSSTLKGSQPQRAVMEDQIVWGRSPARLDLGGGWSDTPPYCIEHGGSVVNLAVDLNGQPPVQVFARLCPRPEIVVRSIDLGAETRFRCYEDIESYAQPGSEFAVVKAAMAMAGFLPRFCTKAYGSLRKQLADFGGGIELSLLSAMPQGSGLGTSSILSATVLGALSRLCGLGWDKYEISERTMAVEQMLTTGGGWQDQLGAIFGGVKLIETTPGLSQRPLIRWLPGTLFGPESANRRVLLYYTGITRLAKNILQEIVRGMFLNSSTRLDTLRRIREHAHSAVDAIQRDDYPALCKAVRRSWRLNQELDSGTNPPGVQAILDAAGEDLAAAKLLGAGGGGYLLMFAQDAAAGERIRDRLLADPPNPRARFVDMSVSGAGLEVTTS